MVIEELAEKRYLGKMRQPRQRRVSGVSGAELRFAFLWHGRPDSNLAVPLRHLGTRSEHRLRAAADGHGSCGAVVVPPTRTAFGKGPPDCLGTQVWPPVFNLFHHLALGGPWWPLVALLTTPQDL